MQKQDIRPNCPRCGSSKIWSCGPQWFCSECGRKFSKRVYVSKKKSSYKMKNPTKIICSVCGEEFIIDNPHSEVGIFYCMGCLKKHAGKTLSDSSVVIPKLNLNLEVD